MARRPISDLIADLEDMYGEAELVDWLMSANPMLDGETPLEMIRQGEVEQVAEMVRAIGETYL